MVRFFATESAKYLQSQKEGSTINCKISLPSSTLDFLSVTVQAMPERKVSSVRGNCLWKGQVSWSKSRREATVWFVSFLGNLSLNDWIWDICYLNEVLRLRCIFIAVWSLSGLSVRRIHTENPAKRDCNAPFFKRHQRVKPLQFLSVTVTAESLQSKYGNRLTILVGN